MRMKFIFEEEVYTQKYISKVSSKSMNLFYNKLHFIILSNYTYYEELQQID